MSTPQRYLNQVAVVTGGSTGIGFAIAQQLINEGLNEFILLDAL